MKIRFYWLLSKIVIFQWMSPNGSKKQWRKESNCCYSGNFMDSVLQKGSFKNLKIWWAFYIWKEWCNNPLDVNDSIETRKGGVNLDDTLHTNIKISEFSVRKKEATPGKWGIYCCCWQSVLQKPVFF